MKKSSTTDIKNTTHQNPCPKCGFCPHCGRGGYVAPRPYPYYPPYYWQTSPYSSPLTVTYSQSASDTGKGATSR